MNRQTISIVIVFMIITTSSFANDLNQAIHKVQKNWAIANYDTPENDTETKFAQLTRLAEETVARYPDKAEPLIWQAIVVSSDAGKNGGISALGKVKKSRKLLLQAEKIDPKAMNGSIYTSLGSLYYQVPGWPLGFGDDDQAEKYLKKALSINPDGIDPNYFYGDFLLEQGKKQQALGYFSKALQAKERPGRPIADKGRRIEIQQKIQQLEQE